MPGADFTCACLADIEFKWESLTQRGFFRGHGNELIGFCDNQWFHSELVAREAYAIGGRDEIGEAAIKRGDGAAYRFIERCALLHHIGNVDSDDFRVVFSIEMMPFHFQATAQLVIIGDMPIMYHRNIREWTRPEGMGMADIDAALGCHTSVGNTMCAIERGNIV